MRICLSVVALFILLSLDTFGQVECPKNKNKISKYKKHKWNLNIYSLNGIYNHRLYTPKYSLNITIGSSIEYKLNNRFSFRFGFCYLKANREISSEYLNTWGLNNSDNSLLFSYDIFEIPIQLLFRLKKVNDKDFDPYILAGVGFFTKYYKLKDSIDPNFPIYQYLDDYNDVFNYIACGMEYEISRKFKVNIEGIIKFSLGNTFYNELYYYYRYVIGVTTGLNFIL